MLISTDEKRLVRINLFAAMQHLLASFTIAQDSITARDLVRGRRAELGRIIYLEYQAAHAKGNANSEKVWKVYGSPGSPWFGGECMIIRVLLILTKNVFISCRLGI